MHFAKSNIALMLSAAILAGCAGNKGGFELEENAPTRPVNSTSNKSSSSTTSSSQASSSAAQTSPQTNSSTPSVSSGTTTSTNVPKPTAPASTTPTQPAATTPSTGTTNSTPNTSGTTATTPALSKVESSVPKAPNLAGFVAPKVVPTGSATANPDTTPAVIATPVPPTTNTTQPSDTPAEPAPEVEISVNNKTIDNSEKAGLIDNFIYTLEPPKETPKVDTPPAEESPKTSDETANTVPPATENNGETKPPAEPEKPVVYVDDAPEYAADTNESGELQLPSILQPALGYSTNIPRRAWDRSGAYFKDEERDMIGFEEIKTLYEKLSNVPFETVIKTHKTWSFDSYLSDSHADKKRNFTFIRSGLVMNSFTKTDFDFTVKERKTGPYGFVYYKGENPSKALPVEGNVQYTGFWDFTTDAKRDRDKQQFSEGTQDAGNRYGATSADEAVNEDKNLGPVGHSSEFTANFAEKTLKGSLKRNHFVTDENAQRTLTQTERYTIDTSITGNRFRGKATPTNSTDPYFGAASNLVEGGFYGDQAQELAGKFVTNDNGLFVVFGAKQGDTLAATETKFDAVKISLENLEKSEMDTFGKATQLVIDGKAVSLLNPEELTKNQVNFTASSDNLNVMKHGKFSVKNGQEAMFLVGERTDSAALPTEGKVKYSGKWQGQIVAKNDEKWQSQAENKAEFDIDFAAKNLTGRLTEGTATVLNIEANLDKNGFSGKAKTEDGFKVGESAVQLNADVNGAFFGRTGSELGGTIYQNQTGEDRIGATFGAKRQVPQAQ